MPRLLRIEYPGKMIHVMSRGNRREDIFLDEVVLNVCHLDKSTLTR